MRRNIRVFRYDPSCGGSGHFDSFTLDVPNEAATTILDLLLRLQQEQDPTLAFRFACRVSMCGSCGMVINGREALACKTNVSDLPAGREISIRPLNNVPIIKDLVVDMEPLFQKYEQILPFYEPKQETAEPAQIRPDSSERLAIGNATECIACGCCVSSCTMAYYHQDYAGPAALNRAFTLLADSRDGLADERLDRALESCHECRSEFNCTEVCPKGISPTRAIKYIQRMALTHRPKSRRVAPAESAEAGGVQQLLRTLDRRAVLAGLMGAGAAAALAAVTGSAWVGPALSERPKRWIRVTRLSDLTAQGVTTVLMKYEIHSGIYAEQISTPVLVSRTGNELVCFNSTCTHLGCTVRWDAQSSWFRCACHGGTFDRQGRVLAGPPPRPLDRYRFKVDSGYLLVEVG